MSDLNEAILRFEAAIEQREAKVRDAFAKATDKQVKEQLDILKKDPVRYFRTISRDEKMAKKCGDVLALSLFRVLCERARGKALEREQ